MRPTLLIRSIRSKTLADCTVRQFSSSTVSQLEDQVVLYGGYGSPYTRKVQSALRYKRIPFISQTLMPGNITGEWDTLGLDHIKAKVIPVIKYPDGTCMNDSTLILQDLDARYPERKILPLNPGTRFLSLLLEDMFDEWGVKVMFGKRWQEKIDQKWSAEWLGLDFMMGKGMPLDQVREFARQFGSRQIKRMGMVGCKNKDTVDRSFDAIAHALNWNLEKGSMFLLGETPTVADFALYGQLSQLVIDISPDRVLREKYPNVWAWVRKCEDLSGMDSAHYSDQEVILNFLRLTGGTYLPFLEANRAALQQGSAELRVEILQGIVHKQPPFKYQDKCWRILQEDYSALDDQSKAAVDALLEPTGCLRFFK